MAQDIHIFAQPVDGKALSQFHDAMKQPFAVKGALMADAHPGYSLPIGGVVATRGVVVPAWVGYDIGCDEQERVWIIIHSGSRGIGHDIAQHHMKKASGSTKAREGHFGYDADSHGGRQYIDDLAFCLDFALANRREMIERVNRVLGRYLSGAALWDQLINRNHNHAEIRRCDGEDLWIHRKGATHAEEGMMGVIPGNMRDGSFIVRGKGHPDALWSSSHGAGRVMGRQEAKKRLKLDAFTRTMRGITARVERSTLDESPAAYKDIFAVMELQKDLVEVTAHVTPIINIKG